MVHRICLAVALLSAPAAGCHISGCRDGDGVCAALTDIDTTGTSESSGDTPTSTTITTTTTGSTGDTTTGSTTEPPGPSCGDGVVDAGEQCDDGNDDDADACSNACTAAVCGDAILQTSVEECDDGDGDNTDSCVEGCKFATCGDGFVRQGAEACDMGADNDDQAYGGCTKTCTFGPRCGDAKVNGPEECDDQNDDETDGCLTSCAEARSCLQIKQALPAAPTGIYRIWPEDLGGEISHLVWCDMDTDGGGYTFLKIDTQFGQQGDKGAQAAETICQSYGMHLIVTRTPDHAKAAYAVATMPNVQPVGGGQVGSGVDYLAIMALYPAMPGATCNGAALNSTDCPGWVAHDMQPYFVSDAPFLDQPDGDHCAGCSMFYKWNPDGTIKSYSTVSFGEGASSYRFLCDIGDKHP
jgi:cysteine-rich repeat protein